MLIHSSRKVVDGNLTLKVDDRTIEYVQSFKFLWASDTFTWADHIGMVCKKVSCSLNLLRNLSWFLLQPLLLLYLKSYILPHFDYSDVVWIECTKAASLHLESLLNFACRSVLYRCKFSSASAAHCELGLSTLSSRRKFHLVQIVFKFLYSISPFYLSQLFLTPSSSYHTRSSSQLNLPAARLSYGQRIFSFAGASVWRSVPATTQQIRGFQVFSAKCESHSTFFPSVSLFLYSFSFCLLDACENSLWLKVPQCKYDPWYPDTLIETTKQWEIEIQYWSVNSVTVFQVDKCYVCSNSASCEVTEVWWAGNLCQWTLGLIFKNVLSL